MKKLIAVSVVVGALALYCIPTYAFPTTVYTTTNDFAGGHAGGGWSGNTATPSTAWDYDGSSINGEANTSPGGAGTAGSLAITPTGAGELGWTGLDELYANNFATAVTAFNPGYAGYYGGAMPPVQGTVTLVYTVPDNAGGGTGTYYEPMFGFNMDGYWNLYGPDSTTSLGSVGGLDTYRGTWSYSLPVTPSLTYFNLMIGANSDYNPIETFYVDDIVVTDAVVVPEPTTMSLFGLGALAVGFLVRRAGKSR